MKLTAKITGVILILFYFICATFNDVSNEKGAGLCDGLKVDKKGTVFATGPGGIWIFNSNAKLLGKIKFDQATSNIALSADEKTMYITNDMYVLRLKMRN